MKRYIILIGFVLMMNGCQSNAIPPTKEVSQAQISTVTLAATAKPTENLIPAPTKEQVEKVVTPTMISVPSVTATSTPPPTIPAPTQESRAIIANHTQIGTFASIPAKALSSAAAIKTLFMHQSTGANVVSLGFNCLAGLRNEPDNFPPECIAYAKTPYAPYNNRNLIWRIWADTTANAATKTEQWISVVESQQKDFQVLGMKYCYVDSYNLDFNVYKTAMERLEKTYPQKTFIWSTTALYGKDQMEAPGFVTSFPNAKNVQSFNQQLRDYARSNNKILYDLADIESHDPKGNACLSSSGLEMLCEAYYTGYGGGGGGHPNVEGSIRMAKGFWYLMARISGWDGK